MPAPPLAFRWDGEALAPVHPRLADQHLVVGLTYLMAEVDQRSAISHRHEFAWLREAWLSLPGDLALRFPTPEHLRKYALIKAGYYEVEEFACMFRTEAERVLRWLMPMDEYAIVALDPGGKVIRRFTAKSQSIKAMGGQRFQASKTAIMEVVADMLGVEPADLPHQEAA